ncbi:MAG: PHP domain-containing protein [Lachnospiraceae bacterium]|nr:PHP domain-containing protein [Lachnospiraceae bacterium]
MYKIETHMHTAEGSACGYSGGAEIARARKEEGYDTVIVTDHFFRGNTRPDRSLPWEDFVNQFCSGYEHCKEEGDKIGLNVLFGWEDNFHGAEFLIYGLDKAWMLAHPDMINWTPSMQFQKVHADGGYIVQAHPFRQRPYLEGIGLYPNFIDAVEGINSSQPKEQNMRGMWFAKEFHFPVTAGSDVHGVKPIGGGMLCEKPIVTIQDYIDMIKSGTGYELIDKHQDS